jgi:hypothetical protein
MSHTEHQEFTDEQLEEAIKAKREMERIEREEPRYDVEYDVKSNSDSDKVMEAHGLLNDDLDGQNHVPITTTVENRDGGTVMITVAAEVKKSVFDNCKAVWLVDPRSKHQLWCETEYDTEDENPVLP